ncbi:glutathione S-transferase kappa 1 [Galendromus occidentalis]|uniref:Glutathione S-transferase kappa n=1 Tax=Galendromus occidentalis TaxID=34638 RepID=A0AAJ7L8B7_9ACAR|nr:glutathione S-transferase kappa 1 [Galendromus occidentalis]XP_018497348.1 glutathione S-transferase kappa 1 [Galendromus occidentalis]
MASKRLVVELYYDVVSPYSYFCFEALTRYRQPWDMDLRLKPFHLGGIMKAANNKPPGMVPNKARYMLKDLSRLSKYYDVPFKIPEEFMEWVLTRTTLSAQRFLCALQLHGPDHVEAVSRAFYQRLFGENKEIMSLECIPEVAKAANLTQDLIDKCLKAIESDDVKDLVKKHTDEALDMNAFGAPTIVAHISGKKEMYFGQDRLYLLAHEAGKPWLGPLTQAKH